MPIVNWKTGLIVWKVLPVVGNAFGSIQSFENSVIPNTNRALCTADPCDVVVDTLIVARFVLSFLVSVSPLFMVQVGVI